MESIVIAITATFLNRFMTPPDSFKIDMLQQPQMYPAHYKPIEKNGAQYGDPAIEVADKISERLANSLGPSATIRRS
jgi:hypothetical protein